MSYITIITNNIPRHVIYGFELSEKWRKEFDYLEGVDLDCATFVMYKGWLYHLGDILALNTGLDCLPNGFENWHGYVSETYFSGVLFRFSNDWESVVCGRYYS